MNELLIALKESLQAHKELDEAKSNCTNYFWQVYGIDYTNRVERAEKNLQEKFDEQLEKALDRIKKNVPCNGVPA